MLNKLLGKCPTTFMINSLFALYSFVTYIRTKDITVYNSFIKFIWMIFWIYLVWGLCDKEYFNTAYFVTYGRIILAILFVLIFIYIFSTQSDKSIENDESAENYESIENDDN